MNEKIIRKLNKYFNIKEIKYKNLETIKITLNYVLKKTLYN